MTDSIKTRCGFVAVIGAPNAGKSTLVNSIVGGKVSIVSPKVQTTRTRVMGMTIFENAQIIFVDTPGIFEPNKNKNMERAMVSAAWEGTSDADIIVLVVDASSPSFSKTDAILQRLKTQNVPCALVLNKVDLIARETLLDLATKYNQVIDFKHTFMVSALKGNGVQDIVSTLASSLPEGPFLYPEDQMTDMPLRLMAAEITREKLFLKLYQEIPYSITVETEKWDEFKDGSIKIDQIIYVAKDNHKGILLGKGGSFIKSIGEASRKELEDILETRVHLKLFIKVRENWMDDAERFSIWGLSKDS